MKRWLSILGAALILIGPAGVTQELRMAEPTYSPGDTWTYSLEWPNRTHYTVTTTIMQADEHAYLIRWKYSDGRDEHRFYPRKATGGDPGNLGVAPWLFSLQIVGSIESVDNLEMTWPIRVGQRWSIKYRFTDPNPPAPGGRFEINVDGYELITVPAGTFGAFRVLMRSCLDALLASACGNMWMWISPQAKAVVKLEVDDAWRIWGDQRGFMMVLVSYTVKP